MISILINVNERREQYNKLNMETNDINSEQYDNSMETRMSV